MPPTRPDRFRFRRLGLGLLLLALPACGLDRYEDLMSKSQEREQHFRDENKYLDEPVKIPTRKEKDKEREVEVPVGNVFFRPPKGVQPAFQPEPRGGLLWRYTARGNTGEFAFVEMAFADDKKEFAGDVLGKYQATEQAKSRTQQFKPPDGEATTFDIWEFDDSQYGYTIGILRGGRPQVAVAYAFGKGRRENAGKAVELSLQSLAVDRAANTARQRYNQKSPWRLGTAPAR